MEEKEDREGKQGALGEVMKGRKTKIKKKKSKQEKEKEREEEEKEKDSNDKPVEEDD